MSLPRLVGRIAARAKSKIAHGQTQRQMRAVYESLVIRPSTVPVLCPTPGYCVESFPGLRAGKSRIRCYSGTTEKPGICRETGCATHNPKVAGSSLAGPMFQNQSEIAFEGQVGNWPFLHLYRTPVPRSSPSAPWHTSCLHSRPRLNTDSRRPERTDCSYENTRNGRDDRCWLGLGRVRGQHRPRR